MLKLFQSFPCTLSLVSEMSYSCEMSTKTLNFTLYHSDGCKACFIRASIEFHFHWVSLKNTFHVRFQFFRLTTHTLPPPPRLEQY